jgi:hypothetical protein
VAFSELGLGVPEIIRLLDQITLVARDRLQGSRNDALLLPEKRADLRILAYLEFERNRFRCACADRVRAESIDRPVPRDADEPGARRSERDVVGFGPIPHGNENVLQDFVSLAAISQDTENEAIQEPVVTVVQVADRARLARRNALNERDVLAIAFRTLGSRTPRFQGGRIVTYGSGDDTEHLIVSGSGAELPGLYWRRRAGGACGQAEAGAIRMLEPGDTVRRLGLKTQHLPGVLVLAMACAIHVAAAQQPTALNWYRGNLHTHTINSDGDSSPWDVVTWYKRNGYQFLAITDHNTFTDPEPFDSNPNDNFLLLGAEEVTNDKTVHVNAIGITKVIPPHRNLTVTEILQASIDAVRAQDGVSLVNHPNFRWAFTATEMLRLKGPFLLEIASGHPAVNHGGDGTVPATEQMWDQLLSSGMRVFGAAVDDVHNFSQDFTVDRANPGRAWVVVRAPALTRDHIVRALNAGDFYASTGIELKAVDSTLDALTVEIQPSVPSQSPKRYRVVFIGRNGRELATSQDNPARYKFIGTEGYVRARIEDSGGLRAWTQPVVVGTQR